MFNANHLAYYHYLLLVICFFSLKSYGMQDTTSNPVHQTNFNYNMIYRQNVSTGFLGNKYGNPIKSSLVADLNPNVILLSIRKSPIFILFSPRLKLRLLAAHKSPVRSPSYMPGAKVFFRLKDDIVRPEFFSLGYSHHSNGQDGPTLDSSGNFNRGKGKFTTNFYTLGYTRGNKRMNETESISSFHSTGIEVHTGLFNTGYSKELRNKFGFLRTNGSWTYDILKDKTGMSNQYSKHHRLKLSYTYILDQLGNYKFSQVSKRLNASLNYSYQFGFMDNVALSAEAGYRGQDDYNIYFQDTYSYFSIGVRYGVAFDLRK